MRTVKVLVHVLGWDEKDERCASVRCERVARFGTSQYFTFAHDVFAQEDVSVCFKLVDWQTGEALPLYTVANETLRNGLMRINLDLPTKRN